MSIVGSYLSILLFFVIYLKSIDGLIINLANDNEQDELFLNILYASYLRSKSTLYYAEFSVNFFSRLEDTHHILLARMRNPTHYLKINQEEFEFVYNSKDYYQVAEETKQIYDYYAYLVNQYFSLLSEINKNKIKKMKESTALLLVKEIVSLEKMIDLIEHIDKKFDSKVKNVLSLFPYKIIRSKKNIVNIALNYFLPYYYYQKIYVNADNMLVKTNKKFSEIKKIILEYSYLFWQIIEEMRLNSIKELYNKEIKEYKQKYAISPNQFFIDNKNYIIKIDSFLPEFL